MSGQTINPRDGMERLISAAFSAITAQDASTADARKVFDAERVEGASKRETLLVNLAKAAQDGDWIKGDIETAIDAVKSRLNDKKNTSVNTFASDIKRATHPSVRNHVADLFKIAHAAWDAEVEAVKADKTVTPVLAKAFSRVYHMVTLDSGLFGAAIGGTVVADTEGCKAVADKVLHSRKVDFRKVKARLGAISEELKRFGVTFPVEGIAACVEFLDEITQDELEACVKPQTAPAPTPEPAPAPAANDTPAPLTVEDAVEDVLADLNPELAAA